MKKPDHAYHHGDLRNALLEEAERLIGRGGLEAFSLRELARRVGVSPNAAYRHFEDPPEYADEHIGFRIVSR